MTKPPLTLTVFEKHAVPEPPTYRVGGSFTPYAIVATDKRFTDAELAAEWWASAWDADMYAPHLNDPHSARLTQFVDTLHRFATSPHYDEEQS